MNQTIQKGRNFIVANRAWHVMSAKDKVLGRLATTVARLLMGKHKSYWSPYADCGDFVIVTEAEKIRLTGNKINDKYYFKHSGYPDGAKKVFVKKVLQERPRLVLELAVKRMLPKNKIAANMMRRFKICVGENHPYSSQNPVPYVQTN